MPGRASSIVERIFKLRILVVEDEEDLNHLIAERLRMENYAVDSCFDGRSALDYLIFRQYDGVIMDVMLPYMDGFAVLKEMHSKQVHTPVMFLTARTGVDDIVHGLDSGADDYLIKPFDFDVLLARLRVLLRKTSGIHDEVYTCGDLVVDVNRQEVSRAGNKIELTSREFAVLLYFVHNQNIVMSRDQILTGVWNDDGEITSNVVDVYIRILRKKIDNPFPFKMIQTVRGVGYKLCGE